MAGVWLMVWLVLKAEFVLMGELVLMTEMVELQKSIFSLLLHCIMFNLFCTLQMRIRTTADNIFLSFIFFEKIRLGSLCESSASSR